MSTTTLSPRQRKVQDWERKRARRPKDDTPAERARENADILAFLSNSRRISSLQPAKRKRPLNPELRARVDRLKEISDFEQSQQQRRRKRELLARVDKLLIGTPDASDGLDAMIREQLAVQPALDRKVLSTLYRAWGMFNQTYFGGRLKLPIITLKPNSEMANSLAHCEIYSRPVVLVFNRREVCLGVTSQTLNVLVHEMCHQCLAQHDGPDAAWDDATEGHHEPFVRIANRIARERGWPDCYIGKKGDSRAANHWACGKH